MSRRFALFAMMIVGSGALAQQPAMPMDTAPAPSARFPAAWYPPTSDSATTGNTVKGKPYVATVITTGRYLDQKTHQVTTASTTTLKARDSMGRVREETTAERPDGKGQTVQVRNVTVRDGVAHCTFSWMEPWVVQPQYDHGPAASVTCEPRVARLQESNVFARIASAQDSERTMGNTTYKVERLPKRTVEGLTVLGARNTNTVKLANGTTEKLVTEWLYSPELEELISMRPSLGNGSPTPMGAVLDMHLTDIRRMEPVASLFYPPRGYRIEPQFPYGKR